MNDTNDRILVRRADELRPGDVVDLEGDPYTKCGDPDCNCQYDISDEYEYRIVSMVNDPDLPEWAKAPEGGVTITFEDDSIVAFPVDHLVVLGELAR
jgi:hypothetical protein